MSTNEQIAAVLGFSSVEQMNEHQNWLDEQRLDEADIREQIMSGAMVIDPFRRRRANSERK